VNKLLDSLLGYYFPDKIAIEVSCEGEKAGSCTADMLSFKGYTHRWLAVVSQVAPFTAERIRPILRESTLAAVKQCTGGSTGRRCGFYWKDGVYVDPGQDKTTGAGEQMNVLAAVSSLLIDTASAPVTGVTGGISQGDPNAGSGSVDIPLLTPVTTGDRVGAGILTTVLVLGAIIIFSWISLSP
jgi:mannan endo-1,6-alpha-mannosidase